MDYTQWPVASCIVINEFASRKNLNWGDSYKCSRRYFICSVGERVLRFACVLVGVLIHLDCNWMNQQFCNFLWCQHQNKFQLRRQRYERCVMGDGWWEASERGMRSFIQLLCIQWLLFSHRNIVYFTIFSSYSISLYFGSIIILIWKWVICLMRSSKFDSVQPDFVRILIFLSFKLYTAVSNFVFTPPRSEQQERASFQDGKIALAFGIQITHSKYACARALQNFWIWMVHNVQCVQLTHHEYEQGKNDGIFLTEMMNNRIIYDKMELFSMNVRTMGVRTL